MEEIVEYGFDDIILPKFEFMAKFDPISGFIQAVGPSVAFENDEYKLPIDEDIALLIIEGKMSMNSCIVNMQEQQVEVSQIKNLFKIDDVLHRITERKFCQNNNIDLLVVHSKKSQTFKFSLSTDFGGTLVNLCSKDSKKNKKTIWGGETTMQFYVTDYNDPNILYQQIEIKLVDLKSKDIIIEQTQEIPAYFSVYTRRLFKNYILDYEND